jgi:N-acetylgalactosamine 4-sulfate 6-O-sulfotransferase
MGNPRRRRRDKPYASPDEFHARALQEMESWNRCVASSGERHCLTAYQPQQLVKGMYAAFMEPWLEVGGWVGGWVAWGWGLRARG